MDRVTSPIARVFIHLALILFAIYSIVPFFWTTLQSFKNLKDANSRVPKIFFEVTWENYQELWLRVVPQNLALIDRYENSTTSRDSRYQSNRKSFSDRPTW